MSGEPCWLGPVELAAAYRRRALSPAELMRSLLDRIDRLDPRLNAFVRLDRDRALADAEAATAALTRGEPLGPLHGVPVGIKDVIDVAGMPTTCHSALRLDAVAAQDAFAVEALRRAGAIILGKLATHEFAIGGPAFDLPFPPARNPWNLDRHPGGSSSGAGSAVAAGLLPAAIGTDTAGSARHPASICGIVGVKPTYGLVSRRGVQPLAFTLDHVGPLTRRVADAALLLDALAAHDPAEPSSRRGRGERSYGASIGGDLRGLRVGYVRHFHEVDMRADPEMAAALDRVSAALAGEGAEVADIALPPLGEFAAVNRTILQAEGFAIHAGDLRERPGGFSALTRAALLPGAFLTAEDYVRAMQRRTGLIAAVEAAFDGVDILLSASSMEPACRIDDPAEIARTYMLQARTPFNVTGHPALAMGAGLSSGGLPLSVQFAARAFDERTLFRVAAAWERASGGPLRPPI